MAGILEQIPGKKPKFTGGQILSPAWQRRNGNEIHRRSSQKPAAGAL